MKLVALMYLEEDEESVARLLKEHGVEAYSRVPLEGHGAGMKGWYGNVHPYSSFMSFAMLPENKAVELMNAVEECTNCKHPRHPIHAMQVHVERSVDSGVPSPPAHA